MNIPQNNNELPSRDLESESEQLAPVFDIFSKAIKTEPLNIGQRVPSLFDRADDWRTPSLKDLDEATAIKEDEDYPITDRREQVLDSVQTMLIEGKKITEESQPEIKVPDCSKIGGRIVACVNKSQYSFEDSYKFIESGFSTKRRHILFGFVKALPKTHSTKQEVPQQHTEQPETQKEKFSHKATRLIGNVRSKLFAKTVKINTAVESTMKTAVETMNENRTLRRAIQVGCVAIAGLVAIKYGADLINNNGSGLESVSAATPKNTSSTLATISPASIPKSIDKTTKFFEWYQQNNPGVSRQQFETIINSQEFKTMCENPEQFAKYIGRV